MSGPEDLPATQLPRTLGSAASGGTTTSVLTRGTPLGRYFVLECLGAGGVGIVYAAYDPSLDRKVALKLLRGETDAGSTGDDARARLLREAQAMARLSHPNVVTVHDVGTVEGRVFIAMELVAGGSLALWLKEQQRGWRAVLSLFLDAGRGLSAVHAAGLVHRDFKPGNVLVREDGRAQVTDFGLVRWESGPRPSLDMPLPGLGEGEAWHTAAGALLGTPAYMAPEQLLCESVDARSDQFAFAVALWEGLFGVHPFATAATLGRQLEAIRQGPPAPPETAGVPRRLTQALRRALAAAPPDRFPSLEELLRELAAAAAARRAPWLVAGAAAVLLVGAAGVLTTRAQENARCQALAGAGPAAWDPEAREQARAAFAGTGRAHGDETFARVDRQLTSYASAWGQHRDRLCRLEAGPEDQSLAARRICLERRHDRLSAVAQVFRGADATVVDRAAASAYGLPPLEDCERASVAHSNPVGEEPAREAAAIRTELAHVEALLDAGRYQEASSRADQVRQRAVRLGFEPLRAEALLMLGRVQLVEASPQTETTAAEAGYLAYSLGQDETALQAWLTAASFAARRNADAAGAERWLRLAEAALSRVGESDLPRAQLLMVRAGIHRVARRGEQGLVDALEAVRLHRQGLHPDDPQLAASLNEAGTLYEELGRYGEALALHQESLAQRERSLGAGHPLTSVSLTNLCATARSVGRLEEAQAACQRAVALREATLGPDHPDLANSLNSLGAVLSAQGRVEEALALYLRALEIRERVFKDSPQVAVQLNNIGAMLRRLGRFPEARDYLQRTVALCVRLEARCGPVRSGPHVHLGEIDLAEGRPQAALGQFQRSRALTEQLHGPDHPDLAPALLGIGKAQLSLGNPRGAVPVLERAVVLAQKKPLPGRTEEAQFQLARALWAAGEDRPRARTLAEEAARTLGGQESQLRLREEISGWLAGRSR